MSQNNEKQIEPPKPQSKPAFYDEVEIEDMEWDDEVEVFYYPCPCGDRFEITKDDMAEGEDIARCPSCSLIIRVIFDPRDFEEYDTDEGDDIPISAPTISVF
ncbi:Diphthamide biosynthesis protein 3 [Neolecta irregularis DAH-3]|uniref:Diphthamide biosynthesis protein 3 n=1 Tax=Neolecta irregularis (strain DAH-3) TaxID=1198029 RepID=A0A1U7LHZ7_NEOID|nr:Diphthamide biosynthesis protein 3 [Neolecta irregularis DAH-3]|eukprot:OLL22269.1 Diphthamide biosynthesis protein 3 [Neolecta irregularis DAH-3]